MRTPSFVIPVVVVCPSIIPYWLFVDAQENLQYRLFNYFPEAHYKNAIDQALAQEAEERVRDTRRTNHYYGDDE